MRLCSGKGGHGRLGRVETVLLARSNLPIWNQAAPFQKFKSKLL